MKSGIIIRTCRPDEYQGILDLWREAGSIPSLSDSIEVLRRLSQENGLLLVAEYNKHLVGTVMGGWDGWRGNIYRLAVLPEYRRQGIGRALVQEIEHRYHMRGAKRISIQCCTEGRFSCRLLECFK